MASEDRMETNTISCLGGRDFVNAFSTFCKKNDWKMGPKVRHALMVVYGIELEPYLDLFDVPRVAQDTQSLQECNERVACANRIT